MKQKFLNFFTIFFLGIFCFIVFQIANSGSKNSQNLKAKSQPKFDKNFLGNAIALDGDSLKVAGKEVRLLGLDAPEYKQNCFNQKKEEYTCGQVSRDFLAKLVNGKKVKCLYFEKDIYNRFLAQCFVGELSINEELLKNGMAVIYNFADSEEKMNELEAEAKKQKLGIWQGAFQLPKEYRKSHPRHN